MSKESYIKGFCKTAEAHGVDPQALAKFAQQYKTNGYAPAMGNVSQADWVDIPALGTSSFVSKKRFPAVWDFSHIDSIPSSGEEKLRRSLIPEHAAWQAAHTNALSKVVAPVLQSGMSPSETIPEDLRKRLEKIYHGEMYRTTNAAPAQVSAPAKK